MVRLAEEKLREELRKASRGDLEDKMPGRYNEKVLEEERRVGQVNFI